MKDTPINYEVEYKQLKFKYDDLIANTIYCAEVSLCSLEILQEKKGSTKWERERAQQIVDHIMLVLWANGVKSKDATGPHAGRVAKYIKDKWEVK